MPSYKIPKADLKHSDDELVHYVWRYGNLKLNVTVKYLMYFRAWDHGYKTR